MSKAKIIMYAVLDEEIPFIEQWSKEHDVEIKMVKERLTPETVGLAKGYDGLDLQQTIPLDPSIYPTLKSFGIKQLTARMVGFDFIDLKLAAENGLTVTNVPAYSPRAIAEMGVTQAMWLVRRLGEYQARMDKLDFRWSGLESTEIYNLTVGVIGAGHIGGATAQIYHALGAKVLATDPVHHAEMEPFLTYVDRDTLLKEADIVTLHTPLNDETANMIDAAALAKMKPTAYLINMARGGLVVTADLINALKNHQLGGAALDTLPNEGQFFEKQSKPEEIPEDYKELRAMPNVMISPHSAFYTDTAMKNIVEMGLDDVMLILEGKRPNYPVFE